MQGLGLLLGHLIGDYILQNDWMAANKTNPLNKPWPWTPDEGGGHYDCLSEADRQVWYHGRKVEYIGHFSCTVHCLLYMLAVAICCFWFLPWWAYLVIFLAHWPMDRFRLAGWWMRNVSGQKAFAIGPLSPWSVIVVDNTIHLIVLYIISILAGVG